MTSPRTVAIFARLSLCAGAIAGSLIFSSRSPGALIVAADNAANAPYTTWDPADNGGFGWGSGWTFRNQSNTALTTTSGSRGWFVGTSLSNNSPSGSDSNADGDINTPNPAGRAWGVYSNATDQVYAIRPFQSALTVGQTLRWSMDNGAVASGGVVGLRLLSNAADINSRVFETRFVGGDSNYTVVASPSNITSTIPFSREGLQFEYTLTGASTFSLKILRLSTGATQTITGTNSAAGSVVALAFKNQFAGAGSDANGYLNSISITNQNIPATVDNHEVFNVMANDPGNNPVTHTFNATNPDGDSLTWSGFAFASYMPAYGGNGAGPIVAATFDTGTQAFSWNTTGSPRGIYVWNVGVSDGEASDQGTITVHVTAVPEPSIALLCGLAIFGLTGVVRHRGG